MGWRTSVWGRALGLAGLLALAQVDPAAARGEIRDGAIFGVRAGMTLDEAAAKVPAADWRYEPRFMVDFSANCAFDGEEELFCALVYERPRLNGADMVEGLVTLSPQLATPDGVHVGMPLAEAEALWGEATLSFHYANEGREYVSFASPPTGVLVRAVAPSKGDFGAHVGDYPAETADQEYQSTTAYPEDAVIHSIWLN